MTLEMKVRTQITKHLQINMMVIYDFCLGLLQL